ncbi:MAG: hypothetical protein COY81_05410 [Candidatus Pacebacteria bacterium CG_4_10_14_0_8_um_filter_43_12]|nr:MAG: hypothetical protein COY81_05410 [Candidatus Pacebacteria bacterium CG_4_10_14_0_8_um_filter_43_12]
MKKFLQNKWFLIGSVMVLLIGLTIVVAVWVLYASYSKSVVTTAELTSPHPNPTPTPTPDPLDPYSIALLGYGGPGHDGGALTDTIILAYIQPRKKSIHLITIPRDIWVELPLLPDGQTKGYKLNAAYAVGTDETQFKDRPVEFTGKGGGGSLAKYALAQVTGINPTYFFALNFYAFEHALDQLGGIEVRVPQGFDDPFYPIETEKNNTCTKSEEEIAALSATLSGDLLAEQFLCRYEHLYFEAGFQLMDGATALKYVRSRHSSQSGNDFSRSQRQLAVIEAVKKRVLNLNFVPKILPLIQSLSANIQTDIDATNLTELIAASKELEDYSIDRVILSEKNVLQSSRSADRQYILTAQPSAQSAQPWSSVHQYVLDQVDQN